MSHLRIGRKTQLSSLSNYVFSSRDGIPNSEACAELSPLPKFDVLSGRFFLALGRSHLRAGRTVTSFEVSLYGRDSREPSPGPVGKSGEAMDSSINKRLQIECAMIRMRRDATRDSAAGCLRQHNPFRSHFQRYRTTQCLGSRPSPLTAPFKQMTTEMLARWQSCPDYPEPRGKHIGPVPLPSSSTHFRLFPVFVRFFFFFQVPCASSQSQTSIVLFVSHAALCRCHHFLQLDVPIRGSLGALCRFHDG